MNRDGDIVAEGMIVQHVDAEEQNNVEDPSTDGNLVGGQEEWRPRAIKLGYITRDSNEEELHKGQERSYFQISLLVHVQEVRSPINRSRGWWGVLPAEGSKL